MSVVYRPARAEDLAATDVLVVASINELTIRHGFGPMAMPSPPSFQLFSLGDDPGGLWIAENGSDIVGFAWSWACGELWFLAQLFVDPAQQGQGIGNELMRRTMEHARKSSAAHRALITFSFNRVSQGLYIRHGLFPKMPIYFVGFMTVPVFFGVCRAVSESDHIALVPRQLAERLADLFGLSLYNAPMPLPPALIVGVWHKRSTGNPAHRWIRNLIAEILLPLNVGEQPLPNEAC